MKNENVIYIVTAYKWGLRDNHSYIIGAFKKKDKAIKVADSHTTYRGGKYGCAVDECKLDSFTNTEENYSKQIYMSDSQKLD